jgi:hypothetical protein
MGHRTHDHKDRIDWHILAGIFLVGAVLIWLIMWGNFGH